MRLRMKVIVHYQFEVWNRFDFPRTLRSASPDIQGVSPSEDAGQRHQEGATQARYFRSEGSSPH